MEAFGASEGHKLRDKIFFFLNACVVKVENSYPLAKSWNSIYSLVVAGGCSYSVNSIRHSAIKYRGRGLLAPKVGVLSPFTIIDSA